MGYLNLTGVSRFLTNLRSVFAPANHVQPWALVNDITVNSVTYHTFWPVAPTLSNQVYGIAFNPTNGLLYRVYNNYGSYSVDSYFQTFPSELDIFEARYTYESILRDSNGNAITDSSSANVYTTNPRTEVLGEIIDELS